jgi:hypothetical protein
MDGGATWHGMAVTVFFVKCTRAEEREKKKLVDPMLVVI